MESKSIVAFAATCAALGCTAISQAAFTTGDLAVYEAVSGGTPGSTSTPVSIVELNTSAASQTAVNTTAITSLYTSASASSNGLLSLSADRSQLLFTGHTASAGVGNANTITGRAVVSMLPDGSYSEPTTYTGTSGNQTRGVTTLNGSTYAISDQGGIYTNGATSASPTANTRGIKTFGGAYYVLQQSGTATNIVVDTLSAASGGTITGLPGLTNSSTATDFYLVSSGSNGSTFDTLYVAGTTGLAKFAFNGSTWASEGSTTISGGLYGIAATVDPSGGVDIYATTGSGGAVNAVVKYVDSAAYNAAPSLGTPATLFSASGAVLKGIDFAPVPEPTSLAGLMIGGALMLRRRA